MKTFSSLKEEIKPKYELKESLKNDIYSLIENTLSIKISNEDSLDKDISINGKEELVEKIKFLIDNEKLKERVLTLEHVKANVYQNFDMKWLTEQIESSQKTVHKTCLDCDGKMFITGSDFVGNNPTNDFNVYTCDKCGKEWK
jgi:hypothetical protein